MPRYVIYRTVGGRMLRNGWAASAEDLGLDPGTETGIENNTVFDPIRAYDWNGSAFVDAGVALKGVTGGGSFVGDTMENPRTGWPITAIAEAAVDTNDTSLMIRRFDDAVEEGVGAELLPTPAGAGFLELKTRIRPETDPLATKTIKRNLYGMTVSTTSGDWSTAYALPDVSIPAGEDWIPLVDLIPLASINLTEGLPGMLLLTRNATDVGDDLDGDLNIVILKENWR